MSYYIVTDATCDFHKDFTAKDFCIIPMSYMINDEEYGIDKHLTSKEFYNAIRNGAMPTTSLITTYTIKETVKPFLESGKDILYIVFSSGLSGTFQNAKIAENELREEYPDRKIYVIDSKTASGGEGLLVQLAIEARDKGMSIDENYERTLDLVQHICCYFTPNDLFHLQRGGRVSKTAAVAGSLLNIKPILYFDSEGKLKPIAKIKGRKKALLSLIDYVQDKMYPADEIPMAYIVHGDSVEDAEFLRDKVMEKTGIKNISVVYLSPIIGAHAGPETVGILFLGKDRVFNQD